MASLLKETGVVHHVTKWQCRRIGARRNGGFIATTGSDSFRPLRDKEMGASHHGCQNQKRLYARIRSDLVGFFKLVGSVFGGRSGAASIDIVRRGRRRVTNVERPGTIFSNAIADCHALVLSQMVGSGFDDERFDVTARVGRIRIQT